MALTPSEKRYEKALIVALTALCMLGLFLAMFLLIRIPFLSIGLLVASPLYAFLVYKTRNHPRIDFNAQKTLSYIFAGSLMLAFFALMNYGKIETQTAKFFIDGKIERVEFMNENDDGHGFEDSKYIFTATTAIGRMVYDKLSWLFWAALLAPIYLNLRIAGLINKSKGKQRPT